MVKVRCWDVDRNKRSVSWQLVYSFYTMPGYGCSECSPFRCNSVVGDSWISIIGKQRLQHKVILRQLNAATFTTARQQCSRVQWRSTSRFCRHAIQHSPDCQPHSISEQVMWHASILCGCFRHTEHLVAHSFARLPSVICLFYEPQQI